MSPGCRIAALSGPRGLGKTTLVADLARRFLTPGDPLHRPGGVAHVIAAGMAQAQRTTFRQLRGMIGDDPDYKITENVNLAYVAHRASGTAVSVLAANGKTAQGLVDVDMVFADEPGAWEINGGQLVADALETALGKPGSRMRIIYIGTLAPKATGPGHWYYDLIAGGSDTVTGVHVTAFRGDPKRWDEASEIRRVNPLMWKYPESRKQLLRERDRARNDSRLRARFLSYRLNLPSADESEMLLSVTDWELCLLRPVPDPDGRPTVGIDLGEDRAWSAAVAVWPNGRVEAFACCPGIPGIDDQERRDMVPAGTYRRLVDAGCLIPSDGLRVPPVRMVTDEVAYRWPNARVLVADRFKLGELQDAARARVEPRRTRWSEASEDINAFRRMVKDGPLSVHSPARALLTESLAVSRVRLEEGNTRIEKSKKNRARDDVCAAAVLACGSVDRMLRRPTAVPTWTTYT